MNSYEINILLNSKADVETIYNCYESHLGTGSDILESLLPKLFGVPQTKYTTDFNVDLLEKNNNEVIINCYGTKYPSTELPDLFQDLNITVDHAVKIKSCFDGDGGNEFYCILNGVKCSLQKYTAHYRKHKIGLKKNTTKKPSTKVKTVKSELEIQKEIIKKEKQDYLKKALDYGKNRASETALIRFQIKGKANRSKVREMFEKYINIKDTNAFKLFSVAFEELATSNTHIITWSKIREIQSESWVETPENLIYGLRFLVEQDNFLYLGFDIENLDIHCNRSMNIDLENLITQLTTLSGVNKTWIKYRPGKQTTRERYLYYPDSGRPPSVRVQELTTDYEWAK